MNSNLDERNGTVQLYTFVTWIPRSYGSSLGFVLVHEPGADERIAERDVKRKDAEARYAEQQGVIFGVDTYGRSRHRSTFEAAGVEVVS